MREKKEHLLCLPVFRRWFHAVISSTNFRFPRLAQKLEPYVCYQLLGLSIKRAHSCDSPRNPRRDTSEERKKLRG